MYKLFFIAVFTFLSGFCFAQSADVSESKETMKSGTFNALTIDLPNADDKIAMKVWKKYMKSHGSKVKKVKRSKEYLAEGAIIGDVNNAENVNVYARIKENSQGAELIAWFEMGEFYISSGSFPSDYSAAHKFLDAYAEEVAKEMVNEEMDEAEKKLKKMESEMSKLKKKNNGYHRDIEKAKDAIAKAEKNIDKNEREQKEQASLLESQQKILDDIKEKLSNM